MAGGTTTLLNGGVLDPPNIAINGGNFGGNGSLDGAVTVTGGALQAGNGPGGSLKILGDYSQTGGKIVFEIDPNGAGGFLETSLIFEPGYAVDISDTTLVFDFLDGANANRFIRDGLLNLNTFFAMSDGGTFCAEVDCGTALEDINFADNVPGLTIHGFNPATGNIDPPPAVPEPGAWMLLTTGMLALGGLRLYRRRDDEQRVAVLPVRCRAAWDQLEPNARSVWRSG